MVCRPSAPDFSLVRTRHRVAAVLRVTGSLEYGASAALLRLAKDIGLDKALYSRPNEPWVRDCLAMIVGRIVYQGSKLVLSQATAHSALRSLCGCDGPIDVDKHCYPAMDRLLKRQHAIQKHVAARHLTSGTLVLYDITGSYRWRCRGHDQVSGGGLLQRTGPCRAGLPQPQDRELGTTKPVC